MDDDKRFGVFYHRQRKRGRLASTKCLPTAFASNMSSRSAVSTNGKGGVVESDSDSDFDNPPWKKSKPDSDTREAPIGRTKQQAARQQVCCKPYLCGTGKKLKVRTSPSNLSKLISNLNKDQRKTVREIGFGPFLKYKIDSFPTVLAYWLVRNYDADTCILNVGSHVIHLTPELVQKMCGIPLGNIEIDVCQRPRVTDEVVAQWRSQFGGGPKRTLVKKFREYMEGRGDCGRIFILNFLVLFFTIMGETTRNNTVNLYFLPSLKTGLDIKSFNWCQYMIRCLNSCVKSWDGEDSFYGPVLLLLLALANDQGLGKSDGGKNKHIIENLTTDDLDNLGLKLDTVVFAQELDNDNGVFKDQAYPYVKDVEDGEKCSNRDVAGTSATVEKGVELKIHVTKDGVVKKGGKVEKDVVVKKGRAKKDGISKDGKKSKVEGVPGFVSEYDDICDLYIDKETGEYIPSENDSQTICQWIGSDGELRVPMLTQYGHTYTQQDDVVKDDNDEVQARMLDVLFSKYEECISDINKTLSEGLTKYPGSDLLKRKKEEWNELVVKHGKCDKKDEGCSSKADKTPEKNQLAEDVSLFDQSPYRMSLTMLEQVEEMFSSGKYDKTPHEQVKVFDVQPIDMCSEDGTRVSHLPAKVVDDKGKQEERPKRTKVLPNAMRSPYVRREVGLGDNLVKEEVSVCDCIFTATGAKWDEIFTTSWGLSVMRSPLESLLPRVCIHVNVISAWAAVLNFEERYKSKDTSSRLFCSAAMLTASDFDEREEHRLQRFQSNMESVLIGTESKKISSYQLVFIPIIQGNHYYLLVFNMNTYDIMVIDNSATDVDFASKYQGWPEKMRDAFAGYLASVGHSAAKRIKNSIPIRTEMPWRTLHNHIDCGVFLMRHMETYRGEAVKQWKCGLSNECDRDEKVLQKQQRELNNLRYKYLAKILLCDVNTSRKIVEDEVAKYGKMNIQYKRRKRELAYSNITERLVED